MPASLRRVSLLLVGLVTTFACADAAEPPAPSGARAQTENAGGVFLDVRDFGAIGDGTLHPTGEWIASGRFKNQRALRRAYPFIDDDTWSIDEVAFEAAKRALPPQGGRIHFPAGHYVSGRHPWRIWRDGVHLTGDGPERTTLSTAPGVDDGLSVAPYRHVGWVQGANREYPFSADSGRIGETGLKLRSPGSAGDFKTGELVFVRNGACRFDQDYGEFNEVAAVEPDGTLRLRYPFSRDYTLARVNWAGEVAADFTLPRAGASVEVATRSGEGFFEPSTGTTVSIGGNLFRVEKSTRGAVRLANRGRFNDARGTLIPAGSKIARSRSVLKLTRTTRDFRCEGLRIVGRRKALNISNSYRVSFTDCVFIRDLREGGFSGGLTIDGDGGRFARFERCTVISMPAVGMQFARSFGGVLFLECEFKDTNAAFTEFNFDCEVTRCTFDVQGTRALTSVVIAGKSCGDLRFIDNRIRAANVPTVFDTVSDIHSQKHGGEGGVLVRGNHIEATGVRRVFPFSASERFVVEDNQVVSSE